jgi:hypothetical protein
MEQSLFIDAMQHPADHLRFVARVQHLDSLLTGQFFDSIKITGE